MPMLAANGKPNLRSFFVIFLSKPNLMGKLAILNTSAPVTIDPATWPMAKLYAPAPAIANGSDTIALVSHPSMLAFVSRSCSNRRISAANQTAVMPSIDDHHDSVAA